jgi:malonyl-CoA O-methyltransferase
MRVTTSVASQTLSAYERWAPLYPPTAHNPLMRAEQNTMLDEWPTSDMRCALDLASGSGRYSRLLAARGATEIIAMDFCMPMLRQVTGAVKICGSMTQLPFAANSFDCVISGLAVGHASDIRVWMQEISRVLKPGGSLLYSDFHPQAARMNLKRTFKDQDGVTCTVPHEPHDLSSQLEAAEAAQLTVKAVREVRAGIELTEPFPNSEAFYRERNGLPIVVVVRAQRRTA